MSDKPLKILVIPDTQVKPGVPTEHLTWAGKYIVDKRPDVIVHLGDHWDMPSLSKYDLGKRQAEGRRVFEDIQAGNEGLRLLTQPLIDLQNKQRKDHKALYNPRKVLLRGNHEYRIIRAADESPHLYGTLGYDQFNDEELGWEVHEFLEPVEIAGVQFAHYFYNPMTGNPYGGMVSTMLKNIGFSFVMGHRQGLDMFKRYLSDGSVQRALIAGSFYLHEEEYKGPQANHHWRGVVMLHEVHDGDYDLMEVSINYLRRRYGLTENS